MIERLISTALRQRFLIIVFTIGVAALGFWAFQQLKIEAYPDLSDTQVVFITQFPGHSTEEMEQQVSIPIERAMNGLPNVIARRSRSIYGLSDVELTFAYGTDDYFARQVAAGKAARRQPTRWRRVRDGTADHAGGGVIPLRGRRPRATMPWNCASCRTG